LKAEQAGINRAASTVQKTAADILDQLPKMQKEIPATQQIDHVAYFQQCTSK
jgi:hypothetical protein